MSNFILTPGDPVNKLLKQIDQIHHQTIEFKEHDDKVVNFNNTQTNKPNMTLYIPIETYINYFDYSKEKEIIKLLLLSTFLLIVFISCSGKR